MTVLITGGAGFLGSHLVTKLRADGISPVIARSAEHDLTDAGDTADLFGAVRPRLVIHLAAEVGGIGANRANPGRYWYANLAMGMNVLEQSRLSRVEKLVMAGTICSYPKFARAPFSEDGLWDGYPEETNAPYGVAKKALLVGAQAYREQYGLNTIFLLPVNLYGPGDNFDLETSHVIPALIRKMIAAQAAGADTVTLWGDGTPTREFLYVDDCVEAISLGTERYNDAEPVNIGTGERDCHPRFGRIGRPRRWIYRRDRVGHEQTERPAKAPAGHGACSGKIRVSRKDTRSGMASIERWRGCGSRRRSMP